MAASSEESSDISYPIYDYNGNEIGCRIQLNPDTEEYYSIGEPFVKRGVMLAGIQKILNYKQINRFLANEYSNSHHLYHFPNNDYIEDIISNGLDGRLSRIGNFGKGIYFASDWLKANQFNTVQDGNICSMLICRVNLGNVKQYDFSQKDLQLVREPIGYDSVAGNINGFDEYVVYDNTRVVVDYVISYFITPEIRLLGVYEAERLKYQLQHPGCIVPV